MSDTLTIDKIMQAKRLLQDAPTCGPVEIEENSNLTIAGEPRLRTWKERLLSLPWRPLQRFEATRLPDPNIYKMNVPGLVIANMHRHPSKTVFVAHPYTAARLRSDLQRRDSDG